MTSADEAAAAALQLIEQLAAGNQGESNADRVTSIPFDFTSRQSLLVGADRVAVLVCSPTLQSFADIQLIERCVTSDVHQRQLK